MNLIRRSLIRERAISRLMREIDEIAQELIDLSQQPDVDTTPDEWDAFYQKIVDINARYRDRRAALDRLLSKR